MLIHGPYKDHFGISPRDPKAPRWLKLANDIWRNQNQRCNNPKNPNYSGWGAKGIRVEYGLIEFAEWFRINFTKSMWTRRKNGIQFHVGRIDHSKNYRLDNIEIITNSDNVKERLIRMGLPSPRIHIEERFKNNNKLVREYNSITEASIWHKKSVCYIQSLTKRGKKTPSCWDTYFVRG